MAQIPIYVLAGQSNAVFEGVLDGARSTLSTVPGGFSLLQVAVNGTGLAPSNVVRGDWNVHSEGELFDALVEAVRTEIARILANGDTPVLGGVFWIQGEADARRELTADLYEARLTEFIGALRGEVGASFPFVIAELGTTGEDYPFHEVVRDAQHAVAAALPDVLLVETDAFPLSDDGLHYDAAGQHLLGQALAAAVLHAPANHDPAGSAAAVLPAGAENRPYVIEASALLAGFSDPDGDILSVADLAIGDGSLQDNGDGSYTVTLLPDFTGEVTLSYDVVDGRGGALSAEQVFVVEEVRLKCSGPDAAKTGADDQGLFLI